MPRFVTFNSNSSSSSSGGGGNGTAAAASHMDGASLRLILSLAIMLIAAASGVVVARLCKWCVNRSNPSDDTSEVSEHTLRLLRMQLDHRRRRFAPLSEEEKVTWRSVVLDMWRRREEEEATAATAVALEAERHTAALRKLRDFGLQRQSENGVAAANGREPAAELPAEAPDEAAAATESTAVAMDQQRSVCGALAIAPVSYRGKTGNRLRDAWTAVRSHRLTEVDEEAATAVATADGSLEEEEGEDEEAQSDASLSLSSAA